MNKENPFVIERTYKAPAGRIWKALTDPQEMKHWYFDLPGFRAETGYEFSFLGGKDPHNPFTHLCKVTEVVPERKLSYSWVYKGYPGHSEVSFELFPEHDSTRVRLTHRGLESFPQTPDLAKGNFEEGWTAIIGTQLKDYLEKR